MRAGVNQRGQPALVRDTAGAVIITATCPIGERGTVQRQALTMAWFQREARTSTAAGS